MYRSIILLCGILLVIFSLDGFNSEVKGASHSDCCEMTFKVLDNGQPVEGCNVGIRGTILGCVTDEKGECSICVPDDLGHSTAWANCPTGKNGEANFDPCAAETVIINVHE
jgi:hypothetical protein